MPGTFPKSHLAQFNLKYLQVKSNLFLSSEDSQHNYNNYITKLNLFFPKEEAMLLESTVEGKIRQTRGNSKAQRARLKLEKQPLFLMVFISYS